ncbi:MAG: GNAT family N-acetyltransferase [Sphingobacteriales bacterium]
MLELNFNPFPVLETERILLRQLAMDDADEIYFLRSDETVMQYLQKEPAKNKTEAEEFISRINESVANNEAIMWAIALKEKPSLCIGTICYWNIRKEHYRAEIGYVLHPGYWKKGIMKEVITKIIDYGFSSMQIHSIDAVINPNNIASAALLESIGFNKEAHFKEDFFFRDKFWDTLVYSLLNKF